MDAQAMSSAGNPTHPDHEAWISELGRLTREAARLATICFDLARIVGGIDENTMYDDPLGVLQGRLVGIDPADLPVMSEFLLSLETARHTRNDVLHAFLVRDGLLRRSSSRGYDREFYSIASLTEATQQLKSTARLGNQILYANGGSAVEAWRQRE